MLLPNQSRLKVGALVACWLALRRAHPHSVRTSRSRQRLRIAASVTLVISIYTNLIAWFALWRGRRVSRRMARCRARFYAL
jgi:hypothetical protein